MELVILSGKGGTGKTTIATALAELAKDVTRIDCDVDAPNLYMFYKGDDIEKSEFIGGKKAVIDESLCTKCGKCETVCKFKANKDCKIELLSCEGCGSCTLVCPENAIKLKAEKTAETFITKLDKGIISRAEMDIGSDGSGQLVTLLRKNGKKFNEKGKLIIVDGSPGIGCPVIATITGSDAVLAVTEPTKSGLGDLIRVVELCEFFGVTTIVCINKYDINIDVAKEIEDFVHNKGLKIVGIIPYDDIVMKSINELKPITCYKDSIAEIAIEEMWSNIKDLFKI
ncbi:ATP-binding protein [Clostridium sp.]